MRVAQDDPDAGWAPVLKLAICTPLYCVPLYLWSRVHLICTHVINWHMNKSVHVPLCHKCMDAFMYISCQWHRTKTFHVLIYLEDALSLVHIIIIGDIGKNHSMLYMRLFIHCLKMETSFEEHLFFKIPPWRKDTLMEVILGTLGYHTWRKSWIRTCRSLTITK